MRRVYPADILQASPPRGGSPGVAICAASAGTSPWLKIGVMTAERVEAAVEAIARRDPSLGEWAQVAADGLTAGEGEEALGQALARADDFTNHSDPPVGATHKSADL